MKAAGYLRVSSESQIDTWSIPARRHAFEDYCRQKGWQIAEIYSEEGVSARWDSIEKRPKFRQLLDDSSKGQFDVVVVHTMDRWTRNVKVSMDSMSILGRNGVELESLTEDLDRSTPWGKFSTTMVMGMAEMFSDVLGTHVQKGVTERARQGLHLGGIPFGYDSCKGS